MIKILAKKGNWDYTVELLIVSKVNNSDRIQYALPQDIIFTDMEQGVELEPSIKLSQTDAQVLIDELWNCGLRPSEGSGSAGALLATQNHLRDLQKVLDKYLGSE